jgi:hypothetical protein
MPSDPPFRLVSDRTAIALGIPGVLLPAAALLLIAIRTSVNIPYLDDFHAATQFINIYASSHGALHHLASILTWQHSQYKLIFASAVFALDYSLSGHLNFALLGWLGNLFIFLIALLLWHIFQPRNTPFAQRLLLFVPIALLFFAPQYDENINWTVAGLMYNPSIFFSILAILLLARNQTSAFALACTSLLFATAASGNGFFLAFTGLLLLLQLRQFLWAALWSAITILMAGVYALHFHPGFLPDRPPLAHPLATLLLYPFAFLGASGRHTSPSVVVGLLLVALFFWLLQRRGGLRAAPIPAYLALFILITAAAVSVTRHSFGLDTAMAPRYKMYSVLFAILVYILAVDVISRYSISPSKLTASFALFTLFCLVFNLHIDRAAFADLLWRKQHQIQHLTLWLAHPSTNSVIVDDYPQLQNSEGRALNRFAGQELRYAIDHHLYLPPVTPGSHP